MKARLLIALLTVLPRHALSRLAGWLASRPVPVSWRPRVYAGYCRLFGANADEAEKPFSDYPTLNHFFTRGLKPGVRTVVSSGITCPVDGAVGAAGLIERDTLVQAKGRSYTVTAMLGDAELAKELDGGTFCTLYLAPKDYHRIHSPLGGTIPRCTYIPGELWPVNAAAVAHVPELFAVNERLVVEIRRPGGGVMALVAVGATMVGMTRVVFDDVHTNARRRTVDARTYTPPKPIAAGDQVGHFEFGSTVVLLCSRSCGELQWPPPGSPVKMGQPLGVLA